MYAACSKINYIPIASSDLVPTALQKWIFGSSNTNSESAQIENTSSSTPIQMKSTVNSISHVTVSVIKNPKDLTPEQKNQIYKLTLPYTSRAFQQEFATMDETTTMQEHFDHTTPGDFLFVATATTSSNNEKKTEEKFEEGQDTATTESAPKLVFHLLCSMIDIANNNNNEHNNETSSSSPLLPAMCCTGYCCDPTFQNCGLATIVHSAALQYLSPKPKLIIMRTVNPSMLKLLKRTSPLGSKLYPNDCKTEEDWVEARSIANDAMKKWDHLSCEIEKYDEEKLVFRGAYSTEHENVFNKKSDPVDEKKSRDGFEDIPVNPGDAQLRIMVLKW